MTDYLCQKRRRRKRNRVLHEQVFCRKDGFNADGAGHYRLFSCPDGGPIGIGVEEKTGKGLGNSHFSRLELPPKCPRERDFLLQPRKR